jgi:hypothetical protein
VTDHIEAYWCPTITSTDFTGKPAFRFPRDHRKHLVTVVGEEEYRTERTLPDFALSALGKDFKITTVHASKKDRNDFPGIGALADADVALFSIRRRTLPELQMKVVRDYVESGKPLVAVRTTSHAFSLQGGEKPPAGHVVWPRFDADVLGGNYQGHHGNKGASDPKTFVRIVPERSGHPILQGIGKDEIRTTAWLYKTSPLAKSATVLLVGRVEGRAPEEPVAWTNTHRGGRVFYTSLGHPDDFKNEAFRRMLKSAVHWASTPASDRAPRPASGK